MMVAALLGDKKSTEAPSSVLYWHAGETLLYVLVGEFVVHQVAIDELLVAGHINESMAGEVEEDYFLLAGLLAFLCLADGGGDGMAAFRSRNDALSAGEEHASLEAFKLRYVNTVHHAVLDEL